MVRERMLFLRFGGYTLIWWSLAVIEQDKNRKLMIAGAFLVA
jgi:hypothetical protein